MIDELIKARRTARKFLDRSVKKSDLEEIISLARLSPSGANLQPLKYAIITDEKIRKDMFPFIRYAGYIKDWDPSFDQSPKAFIAVFCDTEILKADACECDAGISLMAISLLAEERGLSSCILGAISRKEITKILDTEDRYSLLYLIGLGHADGKSDYFDSDDDQKYRFNYHGGFSVPKRKTESVIIKSL
ncbi:MAG: nitroreductase family protein [Clostridia bacterium]|nr:nitroreductase family protein [Clostridia bacterium]